MANQPKKYQKFVATAATATLVASAIVPVASANAGFTDITNYDAKVQGYINDLADRGIIKGTSETTFAPSTHISRGQVVKLLGRYLEEEQGYEIPEDWEDSRFKDVDVTKDAELAKYAALVYDAGVFTGNNGNLEATKKISRQNMAVVLDRAVEAITGTSLVELAAETGEEADVADLDTAKESARDAIEALNILGISTVENFNPLNNVSRANFAKFLYLTIEQIGIDYVAELEAALEALAELGEVTEDNAEEAQKLVDAAQAALDAAVEAEAIDNAEEIQAEIDAVQAAIDAIVGEPGEGVISQVSAINGTTVEVTLEEAVTAAPAASAFSIPGLTVQKVEIKPESDNRVLVLTTSAQSEISYTLTYADASKTFIGKNALGTVLLKADKSQVTIDPNANTLPTVDIQVELSTDFPEGAEAVIEFETSFGQVVKVQTTKGGKTSFTLTPEKTLYDQVARVTGKVVEVKNPTTGKTYPEYRNATVNTVNVLFNVAKNNVTDTVEVFQFKTAYAEQADRVVLRVDGSGVTETMSKTLSYSPQAKIAALTAGNVAGQQQLTGELEVYKEFYTVLHDTLYSNIADIVEKQNADYKAKKQNKEEALKNAEAAINKYLGELTATDLRNILYKDVVGYKVVNGVEVEDNRYDEKYKQFGIPQAQLVAAIGNIKDEEFNGTLGYYKLLSKFVVLDNVRDTAAPQSPNNLYAVESVYAEGNDRLVLVLPTDRSTKERNYAPNDYDQRAGNNVVVDAKYLQDNVSHQVRFLNNIEKDRYQLTGAPAFKLEDANNVKLISVDGDALRYQTGVAAQQVAGYCPTPFGVDIKEDGLLTGEVSTMTRYTGAVKTEAKNHTISDYYKKYDTPQEVRDELGEVLVVFSESVSLNDKNSSNVLNPANWTIDGENLATAAKNAGENVHIRLVSTDVTKQLRDAVIITFVSDKDKKTPSTLVDKFIEKPQYGAQHKIEVSKLGDWAAVTDNKNIVPTQTLDYSRVKEATNWGSVATAANDIFSKTNAFVVRAAGQADVKEGIVLPGTDDKDVIRILFSEPMQLDGAQSVLNKENYKLNGKELPVEGTSIRLGLEGVAGFENSPCAVTIQLKDGSLTNTADTEVEGNEKYDNTNGNDNIIAVSNVRGFNDTGVLQADLQLAYARNLTFVGDKRTLLGYAKDTNEVSSLVGGPGYGLLPFYATAVEPRVYKDAAGNVIDFSSTQVIRDWVNSKNFFLTHPGTTVAPVEKTFADYQGTIVDNSAFGTNVATIKEANLPADLQGAEGYVLKVNGKNYTLKESSNVAGNWTVAIPVADATQAQIKEGTLSVAKAPTAVFSAVSGKIVDNSAFGTNVATVSTTNLPTELQGKTSYTLTVKGKVYALKQSSNVATNWTVAIPVADATAAEINAGIVSGK